MAPLQGLLLGVWVLLINTSTGPAQSNTSDASAATSMTLNASKCLDISTCDGWRGLEDGRRTATQLLQAHVSRLKGRGPSGTSGSQFSMSSSPMMQSPEIQEVFYVVAGILLLCFLLVLKFASVDLLVGIATFLDHFMTTGLLPFAPTVTSNYQLIAVLQSSKNVVACLLVPFVGRFIDRREAKSVQLGMLCAMLCSLGFALKKNYTLWVAMRTLSGFSTAALLWGGFAYLNRVYASDPTARVKAVSTAMAGVYAGVVAGPQVAGIFDDSRLMFLLLSGVQMSTWLTLRYRLPELSQLQEPIPKPTEPAATVDMLELIADPEIRKPTVALFLGLALEGAVTATTWEYMTSLGYDHVKQNLTWLMVTIPGVIAVNLVPVLRSVADGQTLQILALLFGGASALVYFGTHYMLLALTLLGTSGASGFLNGNAAAMLADRSQEKYHGTGQVFVLSTTADQAAWIVGPLVGSSLCRYAGFEVMCHVVGACLVLYGILVSRLGEGPEAKQKTTSASDPEPGAPAEAKRSQ
ncbi:SLC18A3 [Symbiodinium natans]|uniref:SLC18A3 protein n=1 Tax=Symbiodinium natans TaxID=878477 RepID=A0A812NC91_9DINO|nr:SLC18A3 [Symbiodinium natans]